MSGRLARPLFYLGVAALTVGLAIGYRTFFHCDQCELDALLYLFLAVLGIVSGICAMSVALLIGGLRRTEAWVAVLASVVALCGGIAWGASIVPQVLFPDPATFGPEYHPLARFSTWVILALVCAPVLLGGAGLASHVKRVRRARSAISPARP